LAEPALAIVYSPREWANRVVRHITDHGGGRVRLRVVDGRVALEEQFDILIAEDVTSFLNHRFVAEIHRRGRTVLGVFDPDEPTGRDRLLELGVDEVIPSSAAAEDFVRTIGLILPTPAPWGRPQAEAPLGPAPSGPALRRPRGRRWAVGGPPGGCGASELAVELARSLRRRGESVVLVDADDVASSLAQRLGLPPVPNIRTAIDALEHGAGHLGEALQPVAAGGFEFLAGLANPADWAQVRPQEVVDVATDLAGVRAHVVVNVGSMVEDLGRLGGPDRYGIARSLLASVEVIVAVGVPTPVGVTRLLGWVADVAGLAPATPLHVAINKAPASRFTRSEVEAEMRRSYAPASLHFLPFDDAVEKAAWRGDLVAPGSFSKAAGELVESVAGGPVLGLEGPARRRRSGRRTA
jgi:MinD-like ATPase involved in chromosome partitioning or flagellar assembly